MIADIRPQVVGGGGVRVRVARDGANFMSRLSCCCRHVFIWELVMSSAR